MRKESEKRARSNAEEALFFCEAWLEVGIDASSVAYQPGPATAFSGTLQQLGRA